MISLELAAVAFVAFNSAGVLAHIPQMVRIARDRNGSAGTWVGLAAANVSTVV